MCKDTAIDNIAWDEKLLQQGAFLHKLCKCTVVVAMQGYSPNARPSSAVSTRSVMSAVRDDTHFLPLRITMIHSCCQTEGSFLELTALSAATAAAAAAEPSMSSHAAAAAGCGHLAQLYKAAAAS